MYFCGAVDIDGFLKTYKIMKNLKRKPKNFTDLLLGRIESQIHFAKEDYVSFADNLSAINESLRHYQIALEDSKKLVIHLEDMVSLLEDIKPLPF